MKRTLIIIIVIITITCIIPIPKYNELNNIMIIDKISVECINNKYQITLREIKPIKQDNGLTYEYGYYKHKNKDIKEIKKYYKQKYKENLYLNKIKILETNCDNIDNIKSELEISPKITKRISN